MENEDMKPWERQENETSKAYEAFCIYRDLGTGRSYVKVSEKCSKSVGLIQRWANANNWKNRADAWDKSILEEARQSAIKKKIEALNVSSPVIKCKKMAIKKCRKVVARRYM